MSVIPTFAVRIIPSSRLWARHKSQYAPHFPSIQSTNYLSNHPSIYLSNYTMATTAAHGEQFTLYSHALGPNPWKVAMILEELGLTYHTVFVEFSDVKSAPYTNLCPNGRLPTIVDHHNDNLTIWESGAIILYLVERYDPDEKMGFKDRNDNAKAVQWLMFQMSGTLVGGDSLVTRADVIGVCA